MMGVGFLGGGLLGSPQHLTQTNTTTVLVSPTRCQILWTGHLASTPPFLRTQDRSCWVSL